MEYVLIFLAVLAIYILLSAKKGSRKDRLEKIISGRAQINNRKFEVEKVNDLYEVSIDEFAFRDRVDKMTWDDLEMDKFFNKMDIALTSIGSEYLYKELHYVDNDENILERRNAFYDMFEAIENRRKIIPLLYRLGKSDYNGVSLFLRRELYKVKHYKYFYLLRYSNLIFLLLLIFGHKVAVLFLIINVGINTLIHYDIKCKIKGDLVAANYYARIIRTAKNIMKLEIDNEAFADYQKELGGLISKIGSNYSIFIGEIIHSDADVLIEYLKIILLVDVINYSKMVYDIEGNREIAKSIVDKVSELDMCFCVADYKSNFGEVTVPTFKTSNEINSLDFENIYHPLIDVPVKNSEDGMKSAIITGSNATGKSTFIKSIAISCIISQNLGFAFATKFEFKRAKVISSMTIRDNIEEKESYFIREIKNLKNIITCVEKGDSIVFIDEILRGTNTVERISASEAILTYLSKFDSIVIVASHDIELTSLLRNYYQNYHFSEKYEEGDIQFDYKLKSGATTTRNAIKLLESLGFADEIIENARDNVLNNFESIT